MKGGKMKRPKLKLGIKDIEDIENIEAVFMSNVVKVGNGAMVKAYKKYIGMGAVIIILQDDPRNKKVSENERIRRNKLEEKEFEEEKPYDVVTDILKDIGEMFREIARVNADPNMPFRYKQATKIERSRDILIRSSALLKSEIVKKYFFIFDIKQGSKMGQIQIALGQYKNTGTMLFFNEELDKKLNMFLINIQEELRKEGFILPKSENRGGEV